MTRKTEMLIEIKSSANQGTEFIWYGNVENAEPVPICDAVADIEVMDEGVIGEGTWGII